MKFDYETKLDERECVAYIDVDGDLMILNAGVGTTWVLKDGALYKDHLSHFNPSEATRRFCPGDKITITF